MPDPMGLGQAMTGPVNAGFPGLIIPGNITNLYNRMPTNTAPGGQPGYSTTYSKSFNFGKGEVLLPTVVNGKFLTDKEAKDRYFKTGEHLGIFATPEAAETYAQSLHNSQQAVGHYYGIYSTLKGEQ